LRRPGWNSVAVFAALAWISPIGATGLGGGRMADQTQIATSTRNGTASGPRWSTRFRRTRNSGSATPRFVPRACVRAAAARRRRGGDGVLSRQPHGDGRGGRHCLA
jgi:hypothetical protein